MSRAAVVDVHPSTFAVCRLLQLEDNVTKDVCCCAQVRHAELYVAEAYRGWQETVLNYLQSRFNATDSSFAAGTLGVNVVEAVKAAGTAADVPEKALKGLCIPFAKLKHDEALQSGPEVCSQHSLCRWTCGPRWRLLTGFHEMAGVLHTNCYVCAVSERGVAI